jgi:enoyl-CoA hydratase/carnithine racemase
MSEQLLFRVETGIDTIKIYRPEKLNAWTDEMLDEWLKALELCGTDSEIRVVVITGTGRAFTTGGDIGGFTDKASQTPALIKARLHEGAQRLPRAIAGLDKPVLVAVNGVATGGGLDVALACDIRFAAESARFAETYARMGLIPGMGGAYFLPRIVGVAKALEMLWTSDSLDAQEAARIGLVSKVFKDTELMQGTYEFARRVADAPPLAVQLIKRVMRLGLDKDLGTALELVAANMPIVRTSDDHKEAISAFREKRRPDFSGKPRSIPIPPSDEPT